jgi:transcriptional regulator with XRE-family HTH domain
LASLSAATGVAEPELAYGRLVEGTNILEENLSHVFEHAEHGEKGKTAGELGVHRATVSAWLSGRQRPRGAPLDKLAIRLGLRRGEDLETTPLFLSMEPISASQRRAWLHERIDALSDRTLAELFPALKRLLGEP